MKRKGLKTCSKDTDKIIYMTVLTNVTRHWDIDIHICILIYKDDTNTVIISEMFMIVNNIFINTASWF